MVVGKTKQNNPQCRICLSLKNGQGLIQDLEMGGGGGGGGGGGVVRLYFATKNCNLDHENNSLLFSGPPASVFFFCVLNPIILLGSTIVPLSQTLNRLRETSGTVVWVSIKSNCNIWYLKCPKKKKKKKEKNTRSQPKKDGKEGKKKPPD